MPPSPQIRVDEVNEILTLTVRYPNGLMKHCIGVSTKGTIIVMTLFNKVVFSPYGHLYINGTKDPDVVPTVRRPRHAAMNYLECHDTHYFGETTKEGFAHGYGVSLSTHDVEVCVGRFRSGGFRHGVCLRLVENDVCSVLAVGGANDTRRPMTRTRTRGCGTDAASAQQLYLNMRNDLELCDAVDDVYDTETCVVCMEEPTDKEETPPRCGHRCVCAACSARLGPIGPCPMCRKIRGCA